MPTPLDAQSNLDVDACKRLVVHVADGGASGLWLMGTGAGFASLATRTRAAAIDAYFLANAGRLPVIVGVSDNSLDVIRENLSALHSYEPIGVFATAPYYFRYDEEDVVRFFRQIADASPFPFVIYHNETNTKTSLTIPVVRELSQHDNIVGIKDSTCDLGYHLQLLAEFADREDFRVISGDDYGVICGPAVGTKTFVAAAPLIAPDLVGALARAVAVGDVATSRRLQRLHSHLLQIYSLRSGSDSGFLAGQATALALLGLTAGVTPEPCRPASAEETEFVRSALVSAGVVQPEQRQQSIPDNKEI